MTPTAISAQRRILRHRRFLLSAALIIACSSNNGRGSGKQDAGKPPADAAVAASPIPTVEVALRLLPEEPVPLVTDSAGLAGLLVEHALAETAGMVPLVADGQPPPGLGGHIGSASRKVTVDLEVSANELMVELEATICVEDQPCESREHVGARAELPATAAAVTERILTAVGREATPAQLAHWSKSQSTDAYALRILGRAANIWYRGVVMKEPPAVSTRRDAITRAVLIDPKMPLAHWLVGRQRYLLDDPAGAARAFTRARDLEPDSPIFAADLAVATARSGRDADALWSRVDELAPGDRRFLVPRIDAALMAGRPEEAARIADTLDPKTYGDASVAAVRVRVAEATKVANAELDQLLAGWQEADADDPEPVRKRIALRVGEGRHADARSLVPELRKRARPDESDRMALALAVAVGDLTAAEKSARSLGKNALADRLLARRKLEAAPDEPPLEIAWADDATALVAYGISLVRAGNPQKALKWSTKALKVDPGNADAYTLRVVAYRALGWKSAAVDAMRALRKADPERADARVEALQRRIAAGATGSGEQAQPSAP